MCSGRRWPDVRHSRTTSLSRPLGSARQVRSRLTRSLVLPVTARNFWSARLGGFAQGVLYAAAGILRPANRLLSDSLSLGFAITRDLADRLLGAACNPILVHDSLWVGVMCT